MSGLPINPFDLVLLAITVTAIFLYLREYNKRKKLESESNKFLESIKEKGWETLHKSIKKSQEIIGQAEIDSIKVVAGSKVEMDKMDKSFEVKLDAALSNSKQTITAAEKQLLQYMQDLQQRSAQFEQASQTAVQQKINELFDRVETKLSSFLMETEQKTISSIELELKAARQLVETYKNEQLKLIDENIIAMMEQTLNVVLNKKLTLKDQLDLVYEALEKAKVEKFIV